jgi:thioredoxin-related protein
MAMDGQRFAGTVLIAVLTLAGGLRSDELLLPAEIEWQDDLDAAYLLSRATRRPMLLVFEADWCEHCSHLHATTLAHPQLVSYVGQRFVPVRLKVADERRAAEIFGIKSVPTSIVLSPQADLLGRAIGQIDAHRYYALLESCRRLHRRIQTAESDPGSDPVWPEVDRARALGGY